MFAKAKCAALAALFCAVITANAAVTTVPVSANNWVATNWGDTTTGCPLAGTPNASVGNAADGSLQGTIGPIYAGQCKYLAVLTAQSYNLQNATLRYKWLANGQGTYVGVYTGASVNGGASFNLRSFGVFPYFTTGWQFNGGLIPDNTWLYTELRFYTTGTGAATNYYYDFNIWLDGYGGSVLLVSPTPSGVPPTLPVSGTVQINSTTWNGLAATYPAMQIGDTHALNQYFKIAEMSVITVSPPILASAWSRKVHGVAGTFDLALSLVATTPTTESRQGPAQTIVMTFDKPIASADPPTISEGAATFGTMSTSGNDVIMNFTGVANPQYLTFNLANVIATDGGTGGTGSVRVGFLFGDANQSRQVTVADVGIVNAALLQAVTNANFRYDVNVDGRLTVADVGLTNANLLKKLPTP